MAYADDTYGRHSINLLDRLSTQLSALQGKAESAREQYRRQLQVAAASGFMTNYTNVLGGVKFDAFSRHIDGLLEIVDASRREMNAHKQIIEQLANDARQRAQQA
jgi:hypothetical protein